ncbi:MAG: hypothetical protein ACKVQS_11685 [Fimbriimonadaceae bacterium]
MENNTPNHSHSGLDLTSVLFGLGSGILATLIFATYKQREFDRMIDKSRKMAGSAGDFVDHMSDDAQAMTSRLAHVAHDGVRSASHASKDAIEAVRSTLSGKNNSS